MTDQTTRIPDLWFDLNADYPSIWWKSDGMKFYAKTWLKGEDYEPEPPADAVELGDVSYSHELLIRAQERANAAERERDALRAELIAELDRWEGNGPRWMREQGLQWVVKKFRAILDREPGREEPFGVKLMNASMAESQRLKSGWRDEAKRRLARLSPEARRELDEWLEQAEADYEPAAHGHVVEQQPAQHNEEYTRAEPLVTRLEVINQHGRALTLNSVTAVRLDYQDEGRTLKVFVQSAPSRLHDLDDVVRELGIDEDDEPVVEQQPAQDSGPSENDYLTACADRDLALWLHAEAQWKAEQLADAMVQRGHQRDEIGDDDSGEGCDCEDSGTDCHTVSAVSTWWRAARMVRNTFQGEEAGQ